MAKIQRPSYRVCLRIILSKFEFGPETVKRALNHQASQFADQNCDPNMVGPLSLCSPVVGGEVFSECEKMIVQKQVLT
jgi:hypothetical protein